MALPAGIALVEVTGPIVDDQGNPLSGTLEMRSSIGRVAHVQGMIIPVYHRIAVIDGQFSYLMLPSDALGINPVAWTWHVRFISDNQLVVVEFDIKVPSSVGSVTIGSIVSLASDGTVLVPTTPTGPTAPTEGGVTDVPLITGTFYEPTVDEFGNLVVRFTSNWGIDSFGKPYYNPNGATAGEEAALVVASNGALTLVRPNTAISATSGPRYTYNSDGTVATSSDGEITQTYVYSDGVIDSVSWTYAN